MTIVIRLPGQTWPFKFPTEAKAAAWLLLVDGLQARIKRFETADDVSVEELKSTAHDLHAFMHNESTRVPQELSKGLARLELTLRSKGFQVIGTRYDSSNGPDETKPTEADSTPPGPKVGDKCSYCSEEFQAGMKVLVQETMDHNRFEYCCRDCMIDEELTVNDGFPRVVV
jgi:hypothetical protein